MAFKDWFGGLFQPISLPDVRATVRAWLDSKEEPFREAAGTSIDPDEDQWRKLTGDANRDLAPLTQSRMQRIAHYLWESNLLGNRLIELPLAYLLAEGVKLKVPDPEGQKALDRFWRDPINDMDIKLPKKVRELAIFGEQCYPAFVNEHDGMVRIGYLDPALIETVVLDPDNPEQPIGVVTVKNKKGVARRYRVIINGDEDVFTLRTQAIRARFADSDAFYFRVNDLSSGARGRSDLLAQADWLDAYDEFMFGELDRYKLLRALVWDLEVKNASPDAIAKKAKEVVLPKSGGVYVHNDSETLEPKTPELSAADTSTGARLFRNHVLGGATMPETWFGGGGDVNRATAAEMNEPTFKIYSMRQRYLKHMLESIGRYVLLKAKDSNIDWGDPDYAVEAQFPELAVKDTTKYAAALQQVAVACVTAITNKLMSREYAVKLIGAVAARLGVEADPADELAKAEKEASKAAEADTFTTPPAADEDDKAAGDAGAGAAAA